MFDKRKTVIDYYEKKIWKKKNHFLKTVYKTIIYNVIGSANNGGYSIRIPFQTRNSDSLVL